MSHSTHSRPPDKAGKNLIKAFTWAGAILGAGALGLAKTVVLFGEELGWVTHPPVWIAGYWWIIGGAVLGFLASWLMVRARRRS